MQPVSVLESLSKLQHLDVRLADVGAPTVIARLAKRGVEVVTGS